jgi:hypothetical protein
MFKLKMICLLARYISQRFGSGYPDLDPHENVAVPNTAIGLVISFTSTCNP